MDSLALAAQTNAVAPMPQQKRLFRPSNKVIQIRANGSNNHPHRFRRDHFKLVFEPYIESEFLIKSRCTIVVLEARQGVLDPSCIAVRIPSFLRRHAWVIAGKRIRARDQKHTSGKRIAEFTKLSSGLQIKTANSLSELVDKAFRIRVDGRKQNSGREE